MNRKLIHKFGLLLGLMLLNVVCVASGQTPLISYSKSSTLTLSVNNAMSPLNIKNEGGAVIVETWALGGSQDKNSSEASLFSGIANDADFSRVYVSDKKNHQILQINTSTGYTTVIAGTGKAGYADHSIATQAMLNSPMALALSKDQKLLFIADMGNHCIRVLSLLNGELGTLAGNGVAGIKDGIGANASFNTPCGLAISRDGNYLVVADRNNHSIRKVDIASKNVTTLAGLNGVTGNVNGKCKNSRFNAPMSIAISNDGGVMYVADTENRQIKKIDLQTDSVSIFLGNGKSDYKDGTGLDASFYKPISIVSAVRGGILYILDGNRIRKVLEFNAEVKSLGCSTGLYYTDQSVTLENEILALSSDKNQNIFFADLFTGLQCIRPSFTISPDLPDGLTIDPLDGTVSGKPMITQVAKQYTVTVNARYEPNNTSLFISVQPIEPNVTYSITTYTFTVGAMISEIIPITSDKNLKYTITPSLPSGLIFNANTGGITGTPTVQQTSVSYTIRVENAYTSKTLTLSIATVFPYPPPLIVYKSFRNVFYVGQDVNLTLTNNGGKLEGVTITPTLPLGLNFDVASGKLWGSPNSTMPTKSYLVTARNIAGESTVSMSIQIVEYPILKYEKTHYYLEYDASIRSITPTIKLVDGVFSVSPSLPKGLQIDSNTGEIFGKPIETLLNTIYTVSFKNIVGEVSCSFTVSVLQLPYFSYNQTKSVFTQRVKINTLTVNNSGGVIASFTIQPSLPYGLYFNPQNGNISGMSSAVSASRVYTVTAYNQVGKFAQGLNITVLSSPKVPQILYTITTLTLEQGIEMMPLYPNNSGGEVVSYKISPDLPQGVQIDPNNGKISGMPVVVSERKIYHIVAANTTGGSSYFISIEVFNTKSPSIYFEKESYYILKNTEVNIPLVNLGGNINSITFVPELPSGLKFDLNKCAIHGRLAKLQDKVNYLVRAFNIRGESSCSLSLSVVSPPEISYSSITYREKINSFIETITMSNLGTSASFTIHPALPHELYLDSSSGNIYGYITEDLGSKIYVVEAVNHYGIASTTLYIEILSEDSSQFIKVSPYHRLGSGGHFEVKLLKLDFEVSNVKLIVLDSLGNVVFSAEDYDNSWDYTGNINHTELTPGNYYFSLNIIGGGGQKKIYRGIFHVLE